MRRSNLTFDAPSTWIVGARLSWEFTRAFAAGFTAQINVLDVFPRLVSLGLCDFLEEVMSRADLLHDAPVRHLVLGN